MTGAIDIHTHVVPEHLPNGPGVADWPCVRHGGCGRADVVIKDRVFRKITDECWNIDARLSAMDRMGIGRQVLSPMPKLLSYDFSVDAAQVMAAHVNEAIAEMVAADPEHFSGLGMVTLQDPDLAARQLEGLKAQGLAGVEIGTNVTGVVIGDRRFDAFFAQAEALGMALFLHPLEPAGRERLVGPAALAAAVAFPLETAFALASLITGGCLERHPRLRLAASHGGGGFALVEPRLSHASEQFEDIGKLSAAGPRDLAKSVFYDSLVYDSEILELLIGRFGVGQIVLGTDFPFRIQETDPIGMLQPLLLSYAEQQMLQAGNARRFLGL